MSIYIRSTIQFLIMVAIAIFVFFILDHKIPAIIMAVLSIVVLVSGLFFPTFFRLIEKSGRVIAHGVTVGLTWTLLTPFFFICFALGRVLLRLLKKDPLDREFPSKAKTSWMPKETKNKESYKRLY